MTVDAETATPTQLTIETLQRRVADLEQQIEAQQQVMEERDLLRTLINTLPDLIYVKDTTSRFVVANTAIARLMGASTPDGLLGKTDFDFYPHDLAARYYADEQAVVESDRPLISHEEQGLGPDGDQRWLATTKVPVRDRQGRVVALAGTGRDITERKRTEEKMREQMAAIESALDGMAILDPQGIYRYMNQAHATIHGYDHPDELIGKPWSVVVPDHMLPWYEQELLPQLAQNRYWRGETTSKRRDGSLHPTEAALTMLDDGRMVCVVRDLSEQKRAEAERIRLQDEIISSQAAALAELSTPLIPISDEVMVMPLVGTLDTRRTQQVIDTLLEGIAASKAQTAILDITGVPVVDTQVANALVRAAQSVRLLGAQVVLTGIRPEVAQTLVGLGNELGGIVTRSSLQSGIAYAFNQR
jgi:rsbT co-antagonist protein RsbR